MSYMPILVFQENGRRTIGIPPNREIEGEELCPLCGSNLADEYIPGFGFAYGGYGTYWYCTSETCLWFYKEMED